MPALLPTLRCPVCATSHVPVSGELRNGVYAGDCQNCGFFFKFRAVEPRASTLTFTINGASHTVGNEYDPATSLNEYLRVTETSKGTKQMCIEGGCGVCVVTATLRDPVSGSDKVYAINSCLTQLYMCDGWDITTIEGLGSPDTQLHPVQQRLAQYNGSQCGYCSPGQVMNMYGLLQNNPNPTKQQIEDAVDSTLCRCTGYRSILDAMKSFSSDVPNTVLGGPIDIEDLNPKLCKKSGQPCTGRCSTEKKGEQESSGRPIHISAARAQWFKPASLQELCQLLKQHQDDHYRLVFGNTGYGVFKEIGPWMYNVLIDVRGVPDFYRIDFDPTIVFGANLSLSNLLDLFERGSNDPATKAYFADFARHTKLIATGSIRNVACWTGNLMLKHKHPFFISDVFTMFETVGARLLIVDGDENQTQVSLADFLKLDMKGKVITGVLLPTYTGQPQVRIRTFRVAQRLQLCHGYVLAGFNMKLDDAHNHTVTEKPTIVYQGIAADFNHAVQTENYLLGKQLGDPQVLQGALSTLMGEMNPASDPVLASPEYRKKLAAGLFYKFVLGAMPSKVAQRFQSGASQLTRPVSSGVQTYGTIMNEWPLTKAMPKMVSDYQVSGVSRFVDDQPLIKGELYAAFTLSTVANATIASVDTSAALSLPGVVRVLQAGDIPAGGKNNYMPRSLSKYDQEILCSGKVHYAGQPIAIVVADDPQYAATAASMVKVTYSGVQTPVVDIQDAVQRQSFFDDKIDPLVKGDADGAIRGSARRVTGSIQVGSQYHCHLETHSSRCVPNDDGGLHVQASTQWADGAQEIVAQFLNVPQSSVTVVAKRLGGAFGGKLLNSHLTTGACALAAKLTGRPVRMVMDLHTNMKAVGKRWPYLAQYETGFTADGLLNGLRITIYGDGGFTMNNSSLGIMSDWIDNAYHCDNWKVTYTGVKTDKASNTYCRSPGSAPAMFIMESIMEHVAKALNKDPTDVRKLNLYTQGQSTPTGLPLSNCNIREIVTQLETSADLANRKTQIQQFNQANRWRKRGLSMVPTRFRLSWALGTFNTMVAIYHGDGTVMVDQGGAEMGQGINTKTMQVAAFELGVPMESIRVKAVSSVTNANSILNGGSIGCDLNCLAVLECCKMLKARMEPVRQTLDNPTWKQLVAACWGKGVDLSAHYYTNPALTDGYNVYAAVAAEAELDVLTGESQINRVDILYDAGESINPDIDIGQIEGGFVMALGLHLTEKLKYDPTTGALLTDGTWEYKPPMPKDIPIDFRVSMLKNNPNPTGVLRSKATGEPGIVLAPSALFAIKHAAEAARSEIGQDNFFTLNSPALVEDRQTCCLLDTTQFTLGQ